MAGGDDEDLWLTDQPSSRIMPTSAPLTASCPVAGASLPALNQADASELWGTISGHANSIATNPMARVGATSARKVRRRLSGVEAWRPEDWRNTASAV